MSSKWVFRLPEKLIIAKWIGYFALVDLLFLPYFQKFIIPFSLPVILLSMLLCGMRIKNDNYLRLVIKYQIIPLLQDYFYDDYAEIKNILGDKIIGTDNRQSKLLEKGNEVGLKKALLEALNPSKNADEVIEFLQLSQVADELSGNLSGGQKKLLELGRTMMVDAKIVFLDEVGAGVNRTLLNTLGDAIQRLNKERGYTFCMIEHDMDFIGRLCDPVIVMAEGALLAEGSIDEIKTNEHVIEAYLGTGLKNNPSGNAEPIS